MPTTTAHLLTFTGFFVAASLMSSAAHAEPSVAKAPTQPETREGQTMRTAGWLTLGGALAALTGSVVLFRLADEKPAPDASPGQVSARNDSMRREHGAAEILLLASAVSAATGVSLVLLAPNDEASPHVAIGLGTVTLETNF